MSDRRVTTQALHLSHPTTRMRAAALLGAGLLIPGAGGAGRREAHP